MIPQYSKVQKELLSVTKDTLKKAKWPLFTRRQNQQLHSIVKSTVYTIKKINYCGQGPKKDDFWAKKDNLA